MLDYYYFMIEGYSRPFGYIHKSILEAFPLSSDWSLDKDQRFLTMVGAKSFEERSRILGDTLARAVKEGAPTSPRKIYGETLRLVSSNGEHIANLDRSSVDLFGVISFSAHAILYTIDDGVYQFLVPRRSVAKPTVPNKLDGTVAGIIWAGEKPMDSMVRILAAEASIPEHYTQAYLRSRGTISYQMSITSTGRPGCQHVVYYLYELEISPDLTLEPTGEVEEFMMMELHEVKEALIGGEFAEDQAVVWLAYLIRHGLVTPENEPDFVETWTRMHRKHDLFVAS